MRSCDKESNSPGWYRRNMQQVRRLGLARGKLNQELDILHFVRDTRIVELLKKVVLSRR